MHSIATRSAMILGLILASASPRPPAQADEPRPTAIERYGLGGHIQAIGLHHGFHVETVAADSPAAKDHLKANDVVMKVDGEDVRSLDHFRALMAEAYIEDGEVAITYTRGSSIDQRVIKGHLKPTAKSAAKKRRSDPADDDAR